MRLVTPIVVTAAMVLVVASSPAQARSKDRTPRMPGVSCSTPLKLYDGASLTGTIASVYTRGLWVNLSTLSFDNRTTSYKVGACAVELASGTNGGGSRYPECLFAGCVENVMLPGWNNTISSVYLY